MVAHRPDPLEKLHLLLVANRLDDLAEGFQLHRVDGRSHPAGVAPERLDRSGVIAQPEPAKAEVAVGLGRAFPRQRVEIRRRRSPQALSRLLQGTREPPSLRVVEPLGHRREPIRRLQPQRDLLAGQHRSQRRVRRLVRAQRLGQLQMRDPRRHQAEVGQVRAQRPDGRRQSPSPCESPASDPQAPAEAGPRPPEDRRSRPAGGDTETAPRDAAGSTFASGSIRSRASVNFS